MDTKTFIRILLARQELSVNRLAKKLECTQQSLNSRINTGRFSVEDWEKIGEAIGADIVITATFPNGEVITTKGTKK